MQHPCKLEDPSRSSLRVATGLSSEQRFHREHCDAQVELHALSWMDKRRGPDFEALSNEVWGWALGADSGHWSFARKAHTATEWADSETYWPAVIGR